MPAASPLNPLPMIATRKPSGSSGLPLVQSTVQGKGLKAISSRRDSNSRSPISSLVARFMSWRRRGIGGSSGIPGAAFSSSQATVLSMSNSRWSSSSSSIRGSASISGSLVWWNSVTRTASKSANSTARLMNSESMRESLAEQ